MQMEAATRVLTPLYGGTFTTEAGTAVAFVLPGEAIGLSPFVVLEASPRRVEPGCIHFGTCGGCQYQHADYGTQLELKRTILEGILSAADVSGLPPLEVHSAEPWGYRNRIRVRIEADAAGRLRAGYSLRGSNDFLPVTMCPIAAPMLWRAASAIVELAESDALVRRWLSITAELELFGTPDDGKLQLQFLVRSGDGGKRESSSFAGLCERIRAVLPELMGAGAVLDPELNRRARKLWPGTAWGAEGLNYPVGAEGAGRQYWLPRGAFFQVNRFLIGRLVELVTAGLSGALAWDLFAGVGLFSRALADRFEQVVAVEGAEAAMGSLGSAARSQPGIAPVHSATLDFLRARELQRERPTLVVLDPPRAGLGVEGAAILARIAPAEIVYVSCDPTSLARDLAVLMPSYTVKAIDLIDLFPQTFHLEAIVRLARVR